MSTAIDGQSRRGLMGRLFGPKIIRAKSLKISPNKEQQKTDDPKELKAGHQQVYHVMLDAANKEHINKPKLKAAVTRACKKNQYASKVGRVAKRLSWVPLVGAACNIYFAHRAQKAHNAALDVNDSLSEAYGAYAPTSLQSEHCKNPLQISEIAHAVEGARSSAFSNIVGSAIGGISGFVGATTGHPLAFLGLGGSALLLHSSYSQSKAALAAQNMQTKKMEYLTRALEM